MEIKKIIKDSDKLLREKSAQVNFPLSSQDKELMEYMLEYLRISKDPEKSEELGIRGGVGLAAPQLGVLKKMIAIHYSDDEGNEFKYGLINPKIISYSTRFAYIENGEGCLSVDEDVPGHVIRRAFIKVEYYDFFTKKIKVEKIKGYMAIIFQHEIDHLDGILYYDKIDKKEPFKVIEEAEIY